VGRKIIARAINSKIKINVQFFRVERLAKTLKMKRLFN